MTCTVNGCDRPARTRGYCDGHYRRWRDCGDVYAEVPLGAAPQGTGNGLRGLYPDEVAIERAVMGDPPDDLTATERAAAVAVLAARGLSARGIAERLGCTSRTVQRIRARLVNAA
jgi:hypothetical protein